MAKESKELVELMWEIRTWEGWRVDHTQKGWKIWPPDGQPMITSSHGPRSPARHMKNLKARLKRAGAPLP